MKKAGILNYEIEKYITKIGHTQTLVICDPGLPIPVDCKVIDLSLIPGVPTFMQVLSSVAKEMKIDSFTYASEIETENHGLFIEMKGILNGIPCRAIPHEDFKKESVKSIVFIRTGECSSYANVILEAGVTF